MGSLCASMFESYNSNGHFNTDVGGESNDLPLSLAYFSFDELSNS
jgi:hypothetical protein